MAVVIRLARGGTKSHPKYRVMVTDSRSARNGKYLEVLGYYNPTPKGKDKEFELKMERVSYWLSKGAKPSDTVKTILQKAKI